jgi:hypothetical protein
MQETLKMKKNKRKRLRKTAQYIGGISNGCTRLRLRRDAIIWIHPVEQIIFFENILSDWKKVVLLHHVLTPLPVRTARSG